MRAGAVIRSNTVITSMTLTLVKTPVQNLQIGSLVKSARISKHAGAGFDGAGGLVVASVVESRVDVVLTRLLVVESARFVHPTVQR